MELLEIKERYQVRKIFFDYLCNSFILFNDQEDETYGEAIQDICSRMWRVENIMEFLVSLGNYEGAIRKMDNLMIDILKFCNIMFKDEKEK